MVYFVKTVRNLSFERNPSRSPNSIIRQSILKILAILVKIGTFAVYHTIFKFGSTFQAIKHFEMEPNLPSEKV